MIIFSEKNHFFALLESFSNLPMFNFPPCVSLDYSKGFGGKYGVQTDRVDKV